VGLGGRRFGTWVSWFLLGDELYTAATIVAIPAAMFATGALFGFFTVPLAIVAYPIMLVIMPGCWTY
jgi:SSS family solute:Na+ symporter